jgi:endogenous inhibitor of DNA gyrase (YacG/DUF329 family)
MAALCPTCRKPVLPRRENPSSPFCCPRCRLVDLGRWLGEEYRVAEAPADGEGESPFATAGEDESTR